MREADAPGIGGGGTTRVTSENGAAERGESGASDPSGGSGMRGGEAPRRDDPPRLAALGATLAGAVAAARTRQPPPVDRWDPPWCGEIDILIRADGSWLHEGRPIAREALVKLFASVLRADPKRDDGRHVLVTPVEKLGVRVEDLPFLAVSMRLDEAEAGPSLRFRTALGDEVVAGPGHPLRFDGAPHDGFRPAVFVRSGLWARLTRALAADLAEHVEARTLDGVETLGVESGGAFFPIGPADRFEIRPAHDLGGADGARA